MLFGMDALMEELHLGALAVVETGHQAFFDAAIAEAERRRDAVWLLPADPDEVLRHVEANHYQGLVVELQHQRLLHRLAAAAMVGDLFS